ncbi:MAG: hypothetical protein ACTHLH_06345 [Solirubrobacterales bacterium]
MATARDPALRPFNDSGYEILDDELLTKGELVIWSVDPLHPRIGDLYTVVSDGAVHEVKIAAVTEMKGGWSARCSLYGRII